MKCEQYVYKANYLYIYYIIIFLTIHNIYAYTYVQYNIRVDGGVSHRLRTFLGLLRIKEKFCSSFLLVYFYSLCGQQQNTEFTAVEGVWRISSR